MFPVFQYNYINSCVNLCVLLSHGRRTIEKEMSVFDYILLIANNLG